MVRAGRRGSVPDVADDEFGELVHHAVVRGGRPVQETLKRQLRDRYWESRDSNLS